MPSNEKCRNLPTQPLFRTLHQDASEVVNRYLLYILYFFLALIILIAAFVGVVTVTPWGQTLVTRQVNRYLAKKLQSPFRIGRIAYRLPDWIELNDVLFITPKGDTLLSGQRLYVNMDMLGLLQSRIAINEVELDKVRLNVNRLKASPNDQSPDFNFQYIIDAFDTGAPPKPQDTTAAPLDISLTAALLKDVRIRYHDDVVGMELNTYLDSLRTTFDKTNLNRSQFHLNEATIDGLAANVRLYEGIDNPADSAAKAAVGDTLDLGLGSWKIRRSRWDVRIETMDFTTKGAIGYLGLESDYFYLNGQRLGLRSFTLQNSDLNATFDKKTRKNEPDPVGPEGNEGHNWQVLVRRASLAGNRIRYSDKNQPVQKSGLDYYNLDIQNLGLQGQNLAYSPQRIAGNIRQGHFSERSGFVMQRLDVDAQYGEKMTSLTNLYVQTGKSILRDGLVIRYDSLAQLERADNPRVAERIRVQMNLRQSALAVSDVLQLAPFLADTPPFAGNRDAYIRFNTRASGTLANLSIPVFEMAAFSGTRLVARGQLRNVANPELFGVNMTILDAATNRSDLAKMLPAGTLPESFRLPPRFRMAGRLTGTLNNLDADARLQTDWGTAAFDGRLANFVTGRNQRYQGTLNLQDFNAGRFIGQEAQVGEISGQATFNGTGIDPKSANATFAVNLTEAVLNRYRYQRFNAQGQYVRGNLALRGSLDDPNARIVVDTRVDLQTEYPALDGTVDINELNLQPLGFYNEPLSVKGRFILDFQSTNPTLPDGQLIARETVVSYKNKTYPIDSLYLLARTAGAEKILRARVPFGQIDVTGNYAYTRLYDLIAGEVNRYFTIPDLKYSTVKPPYHANIDAKIHNHPLLQAFVPNLTRMDTVRLDAYIDNRLDTTLIAHLTTGTIEYDTSLVQNVTVNLLAVNNQLTMDSRVAALRYGDFNIGTTELTGKAGANQLDFRLVSKDSTGQDRHGLAGQLALKNSNYLLRLNVDGLLTNYRYWRSDTTGFIQYGKTGLLADRFQLQSGEQRIFVNSTEPRPNAPVRVEMRQIDLSDMAKLANQDTTMASGTLNGDVILSDYFTNLRFVGNLSVDSLRVMQQPIGNVRARFEDADRRIGVNATVAGPYNDAEVRGFYNPTSEPDALAFQIALRRIDARTIEAFSFGQLRDARGELRGNIDVAGPISSPRINGQMNFDSVGFNLAQLNAYYLIKDETLRFDNQAIRFTDFNIQDAQGQVLTTNGTVTVSDVPNVSYDLRVAANKFQVLNAGRKDNDYVYGNAAITTSLRIRGKGASPSVVGDIKLEDNSKVTVVMPDQTPALNEARQTVVFIDRNDTLALRKYLTRPKVDTTNTRIRFEELANSNISLNIEANEKSEMNIIIDELNGDNLRARGNARLTVGMNSSGDLTLLGRYDVTEGEYALTYQVLKRQFKINKGSSIVWTGDPLKATLDIAAIYEANAAPENLIANESTSQLTPAYRQKLPFNVVLTMKGLLSAPQLGFDIRLPEQRNFIVESNVLSDVEDKLRLLRQDQSQMNKQVFALLVLNNFIAENSASFFSGGGSSGNSAELIARNSVSKILSEQLERFASNIIKGVDFDFNLMSQNAYTNTTSGTRTDFNVGLSKSFLEGRLTVTVGRNFVLENNTGINRNPNEVFDNASLNYNLSRDGRYALRFYRNNAYQASTTATLEGYVIETGVGFVITVDYNLLSELFGKKKEDTL
ncbi:translocation/assembly module TamB domain-containing protein [Tellurirhabdus rosea]|uniref:translocation/assembly module TamB domain-containing protein n=1 Tax=Tellurirhabdus rosea TaxID=2674997 RepID=UPI002257F91D|nr:translocation/assembly module TamB domain-containing protein [Tellurirhabdus rosea]